MADTNDAPRTYQKLTFDFASKDLISGFFCFSFFMMLASPLLIFIDTADWQIWTYLLTLTILFLLESIHDSWVFSDSKAVNPYPAKLRFLGLMLVINWLVASFTDSPVLPGNWLPNRFNISSSLVLAGTAILTRSFRSTLTERAKLHEVVVSAQEKNDTEKFISYADELADSWKKCRAIKTWALFVFCLSLVCAAFFFFSGSFNWYFGLWFVCALLSCLLFMSVANILVEENNLYQYGLSTPDYIQLKRVNFSILIIIPAFILALLTANSGSVFGPDFFNNIISWLLSLFISRGQLVDTSAQISANMNDLYANRSFDTLQGILGPTADISLFWTILFRIFQVGAIIGLLYAAIRFLVKPLIHANQSFVGFLKQFILQIFDVLLKPILKIGALFGGYITRISQNQHTKSNAKYYITPKDYISKFIQGNKDDSLTHFSTHRKSLAIYLRYLEWAFGQGLRWSRSNTPGDIYTKSIRFFVDSSAASNTDAMKSLGSNLKQITFMLEVDLYSGTVLEKKQIEEMSRLVDAIIYK